MKDMEWTTERVDHLRKLFAEGYTFGRIGSEIGCSRSAAIGKASRLGLGGREKTPRPPRREPRSHHKKLPLNEQTRVRRLTGVTTDPIDDLPTDRVEDQDIPVGQRRSILELTNETCRWPVGAPGTEGFFFCGASGADCDIGLPYCRAHHVIAFKGKPQRGAPFIPMRRDVA